MTRRSQLDAEATALTAAEASARSAGRLYEADYLRLEIARVQKELAQVAYELQKKQTAAASSGTGKKKG